jgi:hypothetical protein
MQADPGLSVRARVLIALVVVTVSLILFRVALDGGFLGLGNRLLAPGTGSLP